MNKGCGTIEGMEKLAIVVVTYKRQELLQVLFNSIKKSQKAPWRIIIADNENSPQTQEIVSQFSDCITAQWGETEADDEGNKKRVVYQPIEKNMGGSGGFYAGVARAYQLGAQWFWLMDDDVSIEPHAIELLEPWTRGYEVIQGQRYNFDGTPFYWQYHFLVSLGIPDPIAPRKFGKNDYRIINTACFEGGLFKRSVVQKIGLPDKRFFIYWDDTIYGYLASLVTTPVIIPDFIMRRTRVIKNWDIAGVRKLNSTSNRNRYYIMRNRGHMARYFMIHGDYRPFLFACGTFLTLIKEFIRIAMVDHTIFSGTCALLKGWKDSRAILHSRSWKPMPSLPAKDDELI